MEDRAKYGKTEKTVRQIKKNAVKLNVFDAKNP